MDERGAGRAGPVRPVWRGRVAGTAVLVVAAVVLAGCAAGPNAALGPEPGAAGFWLGLWHGVILPVTFVVSLFTDAVSIYEVRNVGGWYDAGFVLGLVLALSGPASTRSPARRR